MNKLTIVGLGLKEGDITVRGAKAIENAKTLIVRTNETESYKSVTAYNKNAISLDYLYLKSRNFDTFNKNACAAVLKYLKEGDVTYAVDGSAAEDDTVKAILKKHKNAEMISGVSAFSSAAERVKISSTINACVSAYDIAKIQSVTEPTVIYAIDSKVLAGEVKLKLIDVFGEETEVYFLGESVLKIPVYELDRQNFYDYKTSALIIPPVLTEKERFNYDDLIEILRILRAPNGCPWDREQTPMSVEKNLIEECYELIDAINRDDTAGVIEETGDVLLQTAFQINFGKESGEFTSADVLSEICRKLISRHTHVFGGDKAADGEAALNVWDKNKQKEKGYNSGEEYLRAVPESFPAIMRAQKISKRAAKYHLDFNDLSSAFDKIYEKLSELKAAANNKNAEDAAKEGGDALFALASYLQKLGVDGETALNETVKRFIDRFSRAEKLALKDGVSLKDLTPAEVDKYYVSGKLKKDDD